MSVRRRAGPTGTGLLAVMLTMMAAAWLPGPAMAETVDWRAQALALLAGAETISEPDGTPPAATLSADGKPLGFAFLTDWIAPLPAYSGQPVSTLVVMDLAGIIRGVRIISHAEPILVVGVKENDLDGYVQQYVGQHATTRVRVGGDSGAGRTAIDGISGATITVMVVNSSIMRAARAVHVSRLAVADAQPSKPVASAGSNRATATTMPVVPATDDATASLDPAWLELWMARRTQLVGLGAGLLVLSTILMLQDWLARYPQPVHRLRVVFLVYTVVFIGWYSLAQLSVLNVFTFLRAFMGEFRWETFLMDPLTFTLWGFVAMTLLLWGRGVYCGWLCPFGAMQELVHKAGQALGVPQVQIPELIHERLLAVKYLILIALFGLSLHSMPEAIRYAEVEPFKTAVTLRFQREWPFVLYALALLAVAASNGKFFCKYLCPLGAALAVPSKLRIFDWLRRRPECAHPCQVCAKACPSQAIRPTGEINVNECHYCLDCQLNYWNPYRCPPLVERRKRAERRGQPLKLKP